MCMCIKYDWYKSTIIIITVTMISTYVALFYDWVNPLLSFKRKYYYVMITLSFGRFSLNLTVFTTLILLMFTTNSMFVSSSSQ